MEKEGEKRWEGKSLELFYNKIGTNYVSYLPDGKIALVDEKEKRSVKLVPGIPYVSFIKKEIENVAFVNIISEAFLPRIIVLPSKVIAVPIEDKSGIRQFETLNEAMKFFAEKHIEKAFLLIRYVDIK